MTTLSQPLAVAFALAIFSACTTVPGSHAPATPQRPTLSSDTSTTPEGRFELEAGVVRDSTISFDSPLTLKYGVTNQTEISAGVAPYRRVDLGATDENGPGDVVFALRHRFREATEDRASLAVQALVKIPTADDPVLGTGEVDAALAGIAAQSYDRFSGVAYYAIGALGDPNGPADVVHNLAIALGTPLSDRFGAFAEVAAILVPSTHSENVFTTMGFTYSPQPSLVFDAGVVLGLSNEATNWQALVGLTKNLGRISATTN
ncbi:hypothetical protein Poly30_09110 [Planctomycetes bacterium Poly30]|uniref:Uncharacterized protein n=1 Tax=Saltatorellus ferox TaxID=2528018 RepID=A0A518EMU7_9BACT|nr:hypothetical protein Poly30_09110 [Planctomycetes bacterium Poly30]